MSALLGTPPDHLGPRAKTAFVLAFALMLSDYMVRSVMAGVLPLVKAEWQLADGELGALLSIVPLMVGVLAWPISLLADRWGHVRSITAMAGLWCLATIGCGLSQTHVQMMLARGAVGVGEAAYGSVGGALLASLFPERRRALVLGAFSSAAVLGTVLGVALGGAVAAAYGWRVAFILVGAASLVLVALFPVFVHEPSTGTASRAPGALRANLRADLRALLAPRSALYTYVGSGLQLFVASAVAAWLPSYFVRAYGLPTDAAALRAALVFLVAGVGMIVGGALADRLAAGEPRRKCTALALYSFATFALLGAAFLCPPGSLQMVLIIAGALFLTACAGVTGSVVLDVTPPTLRATALATLVLFNNLLGLAPGAFVVGLWSDASNLSTALAAAPLLALLAALLFWRARSHYESEVRSAAG
jgi:MFS family permease